MLFLILFEVHMLKKGSSLIKAKADKITVHWSRQTFHMNSDVSVKRAVDLADVESAVFFSELWNKEG